MPRALVTGANGFIGRHLVQALVAAEWQVDGVVRHGHYPQLRRQHLSLDVPVDALIGIDAIFHTAGLAHAAIDGANAQELTRVNAELSAELYQRANSAAVPRFVWLSSIKVLGDTAEQPLGLDAPFDPQDDYARSKVTAEQMLMAELGPTQLHIVRPPLVYGPGVSANFLRLTQLALSRWPLPLADAQAPRAWLSVHNLVDCLVAVASTDLPESSYCWHVCDSEQSSVSEMVGFLRGAIDRRPRLFGVPAGLALSLSRLLGRADQVERLFLPLPVDMSQTTQRLNWQPPLTQAKAVHQFVDDFRASC